MCGFQGDISAKYKSSWPAKSDSPFIILLTLYRNRKTNMWKEWSWIRQDGKNGKTRTRASRRSMQSPVLTSPLMGMLQEDASWPVSVGQSASIFICMLHLLCQSIFIQKQYFTFLLPIWCPHLLGRSLPVQSRKRHNSYFCHTDAGLVYDVTVLTVVVLTCRTRNRVKNCS